MRNSGRECSSALPKARTWAQAFGYTQLLVNFLGVLTVFNVMYARLLNKNDMLDKAAVNNVSSSPTDFKLIFVQGLRFFLSIGVCVVGMNFGIFILDAVRENDTRCLRGWFWVAIGTPLLFLFYAVLFNDNFYLFLAICSALLYGSGIWIVKSLVQNIKENQENLNCRSPLLRHTQSSSTNKTPFIAEII